MSVNHCSAAGKPPRIQFPSHRLCDLALELLRGIFGLKIDISNLEVVPVRYASNIQPFQNETC